jgi:K+-transporting ATPase KdpF subunit
MIAHLPLINPAISFQNSYVIMAVIALFILGYLLYALFKPEKF